MGPYAEFGIINKFDKSKDYSSYDARKYKCIHIPDFIINKWWNDLVLVKTYFHCYDNPGYALARWGVTLIPPESLENFYEIVAKDKRSKSSVELIALLQLIRKAINENKYIIHYGV